MGSLIVYTLFWGLPLLPAQAAGGEPDPTVQEAEQTLKRAGSATDGATLLQFLKAHTLPPAQEKEIADLIHELGSKKYAQREKVATTLQHIGTPARAQLRRAVLHPDREIARRAEIVLHKITVGQELPLTVAVLQLLAHRKPTGAAEALLAYLPFVADDLVMEEARTALGVLAVRDGKADAAVVAALGDPLDVKRSAAAEALSRAKDQLPTVLKVTKELPPVLRLPVGRALVDAGHKEGVALLIDLLPQLPRAEVWRAEEALYQLAAEQAPKLTVDRLTPVAAVQDQWRAWWKKHGGDIDLAKLAAGPKMLGFTLVSMAVGIGKGKKGGSMGRVLEYGPNGQVRWEIDQLNYPVDVHVIGHNRVLIAEYLGRRVTERDFAGKILWEQVIVSPISCQRLPNGNTFIASRTGLMEVTREGKEVFSYPATDASISAAQKLRNGQVVLMTAGQCLRLEAGTHKVLHTFPVGVVYGFGGGIDVLANGRILVPEYQNDKVVEYDLEGKVRWEAAAPRPTSVMRLPNGNTLVVCMLQHRVLELDRNGVEVASKLPPIEGRPWRVRRR